MALRYWQPTSATVYNMEILRLEGKMENIQKPPVGLKPRYVHDGERIDEILCAIERYTDANMSIPKSWIDELRDLLKANLK